MSLPIYATVVPFVAARVGGLLMVGRAPAGRRQDQEEAEAMVASSEICQMDTTTLARRIATHELSPDRKSVV